MITVLEISPVTAPSYGDDPEVTLYNICKFKGEFGYITFYAEWQLPKDFDNSFAATASYIYSQIQNNVIK